MVIIGGKNKLDTITCWLLCILLQHAVVINVNACLHRFYRIFGCYGPCCDNCWTNLCHWLCEYPLRPYWRPLVSAVHWAVDVVRPRLTRLGSNPRPRWTTWCRRQPSRSTDAFRWRHQRRPIRSPSAPVDVRSSGCHVSSTTVESAGHWGVQGRSSVVSAVSS